MQLSKKEIKEAISAEEDIAVYRMYTAIGFRWRMAIAKFYYHHCNFLTHIIIQIPLFCVDVVDSFLALKEMRQKYTLKRKDDVNHKS